MNQINFTGFKNASALTINAYSAYSCMQQIEELGEINEDNEMEVEKILENNKLKVQLLNVQLQDDYNGKDLTEFNKVAQESDLEDFKHPYDPKFLNIQIGKSKGLDIFGLAVNGKEVKINNKNLKLISYISKLLTRISEQPKDKVVLDQSYIENPILSGVIYTQVPETGKTEGFPFKTLEDYKHGIQKIHNYDSVSYISKEMSENLTEHMIEYLS